MKHTPGPWTHVGHTVYALTKDARGREVNRFSATVQSPNRYFEADEHELGANTRLMAAAPDLLKALERTLNWLAAYPGNGAIGAGGPYEQARAAIAKAKSED